MRELSAAAKKTQSEIGHPFCSRRLLCLMFDSHIAYTQVALGFLRKYRRRACNQATEAIKAGRQRGQVEERQAFPGQRRRKFCSLDNSPFGKFSLCRSGLPLK